MSVQQIQTGYTAQLIVRLLDSSDNPVLLVPASSVTAKYKKQGATAWTAKTVSAGEWSAGPDGRYMLLFSSAELDTDGRFVYRVSAAGADIFTGDIDLVSDWATIVDQLEALINALAGKVSTDAVNQIKREQDEALQNLDGRVSAANDKLRLLQAQAAVMRKKIDQLMP
jgi:ElaB/YqjD/DUF883 family membrane-anchored ribosome-binding protein